MASVAFGLAGVAVAGIPGIGITAFAGFMYGVSAGGLLFPPKMPAIEKGKLDDLRIPGSAYGSFLGILFGANEVAGYLSWISHYLDNKTPCPTGTVDPNTGVAARTYIDHVTHESVGGKGGPSQSVENHTYTMNFEWTVCDGEISVITGISEILFGDKTVFLNGETDLDIEIRDGNDAQLPSSLIEQFEGVGEVTGMKGCWTIIFKDVDVTEWGGVPPIRIRTAGSQALQMRLASGPELFHLIAVTVGGGVRLCGHGANYRLGNGSTADVLTPFFAAQQTIDASGAQSHTIYLLGNGDVYAAGQGSAGANAMGSGATTEIQIFAQVASIVGAHRVFCLGNRSYVATISGLYHTGQSGASAGSDLYSLRGDGNIINTSVFTLCPGSPVFEHMAGHSEATLGVDASGGLWFTGVENSGEFGDGATDTRVNNWVEASGLGAVAKAYTVLSGAFGVTIALLKNGEVWASGSNYNQLLGQPGHLITFQTNTWLKVDNGIPSAVDLAVGTDRIFVVGADGSVWAWGGGYGSTADRVMDAPSGDPGDTSKAISVAVASASQYIVKDNNEIYGWGDNTSGELGNGTTTGYADPTLLPWAADSNPSISLTTVVSKISDAVGIVEEQRDFSACADILLTGLSILSRSAGRDILNSTLLVYFTDLVETDFIILAVVRGGATVGTIDPADVGVRMNAQGPIRKKNGQIESELELPRQLEITYISQLKGYESASQPATRRDKTHLDGSDSVNTSIVFADEDEPKRRITALLLERWLSGKVQTLVLPPKYRKYIPTDPLLATIGGETQRVRIIKRDLLPMRIPTIDVVRDNPAIYVQALLGASVGKSTSSLVRPAETQAFPWSGNALVDANADGVGAYIAVTGDDGWPGATVYLSRDSGGSYLPQLDVLERATIGTLEAAFSDFDTTGIWDNDNFIDVLMVRGTFETASSLEVLSGRNAIRVGDEVIQFQVVVPLGGNVYRLSRLLRGRRGTPITTHATGETVVGLIAGPVQRLELSDDLVNREVLLKAVTFGKSLADTAAQPLTITGNELKPYSPVHIRGARDVPHNLTLTWIRRARKNFEMRDGSDIPLGEDSEAYEVEIMNGASVVRTISGLATQTAAYSAANQTTDFGSPQASLTVRIYQIGRLGRGYPGIATV